MRVGIRVVGVSMNGWTDLCEGGDDETSCGTDGGVSITRCVGIKCRRWRHGDMEREGGNEGERHADEGHGHGGIGFAHEGSSMAAYVRSMVRPVRL